MESEYTDSLFMEMVKDIETWGCGKKFHSILSWRWN
jgi:hypothetical protein